MTTYDQAIPVKLKNLGLTIWMVIRNDYTCKDDMVVFADPRKLKPYMDKINENEPPDYLASKKRNALNVLMKFAKTDTGDSLPADGLPINPLSMAIVSCFTSEEGHRIKFTDGISRTTELVAQGTEFIPLQVAKVEAGLLHAIVGGSILPIAASEYIVPPDVRNERAPGHSLPVSILPNPVHPKASPPQDTPKRRRSFLNCFRPS